MRPLATSPSWLAAAAGALLVGVVVIGVGWPGLQGFWGRDDYFQLALARMLGTPWPLFVHDHYPVPASVFRPLGFASMWLDTWWFGSAYAPHVLCNLILHAAAALALYGVLCRAGVTCGMAVLATLVFAVHPLAMGTALWWSARFDVLSTLCVLLAVRWAMAYRHGLRPRTLLAALLAALAALASKEIGLVAVAAMVVLWLRWAWCEPEQRGRALRACAMALVGAAVFFAWRSAVLGTAGSGILGRTPILEALAAGLRIWARDVLGYLAYAAQLAEWQRGMLLLALAGLLVALIAALLVRPRRVVFGTQVTVRRRELRRSRGDLLVCGACLLLLPAVLQAPVAMLNAAALQSGFSAIEAAMQSRLYYLGLAGTALLLGVVLSRLGGIARAMAGLSVVLAVVAWGVAAQTAARGFAQRSVDISAVARAAVQAVDALPLAEAPCRIVFLDVEQAPEWGGFVSMDSIVKALAADREHVSRCWVHANLPTYFHLQDAAAQPAAALPWLPLRLEGREVPWLRVGNMTYAYLSPPAKLDAQTLSSSHFLRWNGVRFEDVSNDVVAGRRIVAP